MLGVCFAPTLAAMDLSSSSALAQSPPRAMAAMAVLYVTAVAATPFASIYTTTQQDSDSLQ